MTKSFILETSKSLLLYIYPLNSTWKCKIYFIFPHLSLSMFYHMQPRELFWPFPHATWNFLSQTHRSLMYIFALPHCCKQQWCQNLLCYTAEVIFFSSFQYQFPHCPSSSHSQFPLTTRIVRGKSLQIRKLVYLLIRQLGFEGFSSTKPHRKCCRELMYYAWVLNT